MFEPIMIANLVSLASDTMPVVQRLAALVGLASHPDAKFDLLLNADFMAAKNTLDAALKSETDAERIHQIREARSLFTRAVATQKGHAEALARFGLANCHYMLGDSQNARDELTKILHIEPPISSIDFSRAAAAAVLYGAIAAPQAIVDQAKSFQMPKEYSFDWSKLAPDIQGRQRSLFLAAVEGNREAKALANLQVAIAKEMATSVPWLSRLGLA